MTSALLTWVSKRANNLHVALYRRSGGKFANKIANLPILLITTLGRKSGKVYTNPVVYIKDGQDYLVSATAGGADTDPGWYRNLKTRPEAQIEVGDTAFSVQATIAERDERTRLYEKFKAASNNFVKYEKRTSRVLPVIRLTPTHIYQQDKGAR
jgi:deazaflavin-dependent oxidoreductase (nitroreductase family)